MDVSEQLSIKQAKKQSAIGADLFDKYKLHQLL